MGSMYTEWKGVRERGRVAGEGMEERGRGGVVYIKEEGMLVWVACDGWEW